MEAYQKFGLEDYCIALQNEKNTVLVSPINFFLARLRLESPREIRSMAEGWIEFWQDKDNFSFEPVFNHEPKRFRTQEDAPERRTSCMPYALSADELCQNLESAVKQRYGNYNLWREHGQAVFSSDYLSSYSGEIRLRSGVRRRSRASKVGRFNDVQVLGPFRTSKKRFGDLYSTSREFSESGQKSGNTETQLISSDIAALLYAGRNHPEYIPHLPDVIARRHTEIWTPIHSRHPQASMTDASTMDANPGTDLDSLTIDTIVQFLLYKTNKAEINKALTRIPAIYDPLLMKAFSDDCARFNAIAQTWLFSRNKDLVSAKQRYMYEEINRSLTRDGFVLRSYALEKKGTEHEAVSLNYELGDKSVRVVFFDDYPPLCINKGRFHLKGGLDSGRASVFLKESPAQLKQKVKHFYQDLYLPAVSFDDSSRRLLTYEVQIPEPVGWIPEEIIRDYADAIAQHCPDAKQVIQRRLANRSRIQSNHPVFSKSPSSINTGRIRTVLNKIS